MKSVESTGITLDVNAKVKVDLSIFVQATADEIEAVLDDHEFPTNFPGNGLLEHFWIIPK